MEYPTYSESDQKRRKQLRSWWDRQAPLRENWIARNRYYYDGVAHFINLGLQAQQSVLQVGCGTGYLLSQLHAHSKTGVDFSEELLNVAREKYPEINFQCLDVETDSLSVKYDFIVLSDVVNELTDVWKALRNLRQDTHAETRILITYFNPGWQWLFQIGERIGLRMPHLDQNWFSPEDIQQLLEINNYRTIRSGERFLIPVYIPWISTFMNRYISHLPVFRSLCCMQYTVAAPTHEVSPRKLSSSVIIPCLNEKGNIQALLERTPPMGEFTEIIFVDGNSNDGTWELLQELSEHYAGPLRIKLLRQKGPKGKGQAVREGFAAASGDVLMILDADITVQPEDLPKFFLALQEGHADYAQGSRLVFPMENDSMRFLNRLGNRFFGKLLSGVINHRLMDTLCGTKVLTRSAYDQIAANRHLFGEFDPFGDFDLIFGAARLNLKMIEIPIRYQARRYGTTKIRRFYHGWLLLKMCLFALRKFR